VVSAIPSLSVSTGTELFDEPPQATIKVSKSITKYLDEIAKKRISKDPLEKIMIKRLNLLSRFKVWH
jgi:hypothetical protein